MDLIVSGPVDEELDQLALDERKQEVTDQLLGIGMSTDDFSLGVDQAPYQTASRRKLETEGYRRKFFESGPLNADACPVNASIILLSVTLHTTNETLEKLLIEELKTPMSNATIFTTASGQIFRSCSAAVTMSSRIIVPAPSPPNFPPLPFIAQTTVAAVGRVSIGIVAGFVFILGCLGQWCLVPSFRRASKKRKDARTQDTDSLIQTLVPRWEWEWGEED